jgi:tRNA-dihydrouridine synthase 1
VPVTAKIRVYDDLETTLKYAKMVEAAGAQIVAVHGRTREQKRCAEIRANWCVSASANAPFLSRAHGSCALSLHTDEVPMKMKPKNTP